MTYRNVVSAVVRALAAETINSAGGCTFEPRVQCAKLKGEIIGKDAALLMDCVVFKLLHADLSPRHWNALVSKFSTHKGRKIESIGRIVSAFKSPAPMLFTQKAVTAWAIPQIKGIRREVVQVKAPEARQGQHEKQWDWRNQAAAASVERANAMARQRAETRSSDMIVLHDSNYDMTTWDGQGLTERTYQRWNKSIKDTLESLVDQALTEAQHILEDAEVLDREAA
jgi:hypothetical protein